MRPVNALCMATILESCAHFTALGLYVFVHAALTYEAFSEKAGAETIHRSIENKHFAKQTSRGMRPGPYLIEPQTRQAK